jgi:hypothetical protein
MKPMNGLRLVVAAMLVLGVLGPLQMFGQPAPRFYWKSLSGANAVPIIVQSLSGNTNPFDPSHLVTPGANFAATLALAGYVRMFSLGGRAASAAIILPMGRIAGEVNEDGLTLSQQAAGYGDPMFEFVVNVIGPKAQKTLPDVLRYEPGFSLDLLADLAVPIGEYDSSQLLNLGQHRWYGRFGVPVVWQLSSWVPGRRTTLEFMPSVWLFGANNDYNGGQTLETDPAIELDVHLTRDLTEHLWASLDGVWYTGGKPTVNGISGEKLNNVGVGLSLGYLINENIVLLASYKSTMLDKDSTDLKMDVFMVSLVFGWHKIIEGSRRLQGEK